MIVTFAARSHVGCVSTHGQRMVEGGLRMLRTQGTLLYDTLLEKHVTHDFEPDKVGCAGLNLEY